jgi:hypothetical protein
MKANELRVGNYISLLGIDKQVEGIANLRNRRDMYWITCKDIVDVKIIHFKPILLTEEWLLKFGFEKEKIQLTTYTKIKLSITLKTNEYVSGRTYFNSWCILEKQIEYVHQLQNLYFALTGEELTIK